MDTWINQVIYLCVCKTKLETLFKSQEWIQHFSVAPHIYMQTHCDTGHNKFESVYRCSGCSENGSGVGGYSIDDGAGDCVKVSLSSVALSFSISMRSWEQKVEKVKLIQLLNADSQTNRPLGEGEQQKIVERE